MEIIDKNLKIVLGQLIRVKNLNKRLHENNIYVSLQVEDENGENERCLLFTEIQTADMEKVSGNLFDNCILGRIYKCIIGKIKTNIIKIKNYNGDIKYFRLSNTQLLKAEKRASKNLEDLTKKNKLTDLLD